MTDQTLTHLYFLLDRSGSMKSIKTDIEGGFAAFVKEQKAAPGRCRVTLAQFDDQYERVYSDRDVADIPPLDLQPRGSTALHDAMGRLITSAGSELAALPVAKRPGTVIVAIMTDGKENASKEWGGPAIKSLVEQQTTKYRWQFLYMGADQDAVEVGGSLGVGANSSVTYARDKSVRAMEMSGSKVRRMREARLDDANAQMDPYSKSEREELS